MVHLVYIYPQCLVGEARKQFKEWTKAKVEILIADRDGCSMDYNTCYLYNENEHQLEKMDAFYVKFFIVFLCFSLVF